MPKIEDDVVTPKILLGYLGHGLDLQGSPNALGDCPFCGKERKFSVAADTGKWRCFGCEESGNLTTFLRKVYEESSLAGGGSWLVGNRGVTTEALESFGVVNHAITGEYAVPGYSTDRKLMNLYQWEEVQSRDGKKVRVLKGTAGVNQQLFLPDDHDPDKRIVYVCEGPWDAMALWDALRSAKMDAEGNLTRTGSVAASLYAQAAVVGVPGTGSVGEPFARWCSLFAGKEVVLCFDSDHPRTNKGKTISPAGYAACRRAAEILSRASAQPDTVSYLRWGNDGYDPARKSGYDVRDLLTSGDPLEGLAELLSSTQPIPADWVGGRSAESRRTGKPQIECLPCSSWKDLEQYWRKAMKWIPGLAKGLSASLASIVSTRAVGDQLWIKVVGPPACGKTTLCEALAVAKQYVYSSDTMTSLVSGYQLDREGSENQSLVLRLKDKTLVVKDADTILSDPSLPRILSQFRAFYDRSLRADYANKMSAAHEGINTTVILYGTNSLRKLDSSELGERFLDVVIMEGIPDEELEDEIMRRKFHQSWRGLSLESNGEPSSQVSPDMLAAMQRTGGYVTWLRQNARELLASVECPDPAAARIMDLGKFVAYMRARPSSRQDETNEREFGTRLVGQISRFAGCVAVVFNKRVVDEDVMRMTRAVAMDTARGRTLEICKALYAASMEGEDLALGGIVNAVHSLEEAKVKSLVKFLRQVGAVESYSLKRKSGIKEVRRYRLTDRVGALYSRVVEDA